MISEINKAVRGKLLSDGAIAALIGTRIYAGLADKDAALPYIIIDIVAGGDQNVTPRDAFDVQVQVKAICATQLEAGTLQRLIRDALHNTPLTITGWTHYDSKHTSLVWMIETANGRQYFHGGGTYRIKAHK